MRFFARGIVVLGVILGVSTIAYAQASITGVVKDSSGAVLPGVTVEASSPALIEKARSVVTDGSRSVPHRRSPARRVRGDVHAARLQHVQARRHRADGDIRRDGQRGPACRRADRDGHSVAVSRRSSTCRARRPTRTLDSEVFAAHSEQPRVRSGHRADAGHQRAGGGRRRRDGQRVQRLPGTRRPAQRGPGPGQRPEYRLAGHGRVRLRARSQQRAGGSFQVTGGLGEAATGGPQMNLDPEGGWQQRSAATFFVQLCR